VTDPETIAIHYPIYPKDHVTYYLDKIEGYIEAIKLHEIVSDINENGDPIKEDGSVGIDENKAVLLERWKKPTFPISMKKCVPSAKYITYIFEVIGKNTSYRHTISFATQKYPPSKWSSDICKPIPIYIVANRDFAMNCVFVKPTNFSIRKDFYYNHVASMISNAFQKEPFVRRFRNFYNFYINPVDSVSVQSRHTSNSKEITFAQLVMILHSNAKNKDTAEDEYATSEYFNYGTFLHEAGHAYYGLEDEYESIENCKVIQTADSNLQTEKRITAFISNDKSDRTKVQKRVLNKCNSNCIMNHSGLYVFPYGDCCKLNILNSLSFYSKYNIEYKDLKNEKLIIQLLNKYMEGNKYDINYGTHISVTIKLNENKMLEGIKLKRHSGGLPYNQFINSDNFITYHSASGYTKYALPYHFNWNKLTEENKALNILIPDDKTIQDINIHLNDKEYTVRLSTTELKNLE
jgi:hypothetical protein